MKKLPSNFQSWVRLYDWMYQRGFRNETIVFDTMNNGKIERHRINMRTVERNAWKEIQKLRQTDYEATMAIVGMYGGMNPVNHERIGKTKELLFHLRIIDND